MKNYSWLFSLTVFLTFNILTNTANAAPSVINTLQANGTRNNQVRLTFTVPNPTSGKTLTNYEVRYKPIAFNGMTYPTALLAVITAIPGTPGTQQVLTATFPTATPGGLYYVAIKARDSGGTISAISNVTSARTLDGRFIDISWSLVTACEDDSPLDPSTVTYTIYWGYTAGEPYQFSQNVQLPVGTTAVWLDYDERTLCVSAKAHLIADPGRESKYSTPVSWNWTWEE